MEQSKPGDPSAKNSRDDRIQLLVRLVHGKGPAALAQLQQKIKQGEGLSAKGITWDVDMLREAVAKASVGTTGQSGAKAQPGQAQPPQVGAPAATLAPRTGLAPTLAPGPPVARPALALPKAATSGSSGGAATTSGSAAPSGGSAPSGGRWSVAAPTTSAYVRKAQAESESAEAFVRVAKNTGEHKVAVLAKPNVLGHATGEYLAPGETFEVIARCARPQDGRTYLRLKKSTGWVCSRSRKDFWRVVIQCDNGSTVEPAGFATEFESRAARLLPRVDAEGQRLDAQGKPQEADAGAAPSEARSFRVAGGRALPILGLPNLEAVTMGAMLQGREAFLADAVSLTPADGRAYLRLKDGRGWVCERLKGDFQRYAVEPDGHPQDLAVPRARQMMVSRVRDGGQRDAYEAAEDGRGALDEPAPVKPVQRGPSLKDEAVVFRSDGSLWPGRLGPPRPIVSQMRTALRRLANLHGRKVAECQEDLKEVEDRAEAYARSCEGKKLLLAHAEALRKEVAKAEKAWQAAVEEVVAGAQLDPAPEKPAPREGPSPAAAAVVPVRVLGSTWHCALVRAGGPSGDGDEAGTAASRRLGPLRSDAALAANDLRVLEAALERALAGGLGAEADGQPPSKKPRRSKGTKDDEAAEAAEE